MVNINLLKKEQIPAAVKLMIKFYSIDNYPINIEKTFNNFHVFIDNPNYGSVFSIEFDNQLVGYIILCNIFSFEFGGKIIFLDELFIDESARGKGIGNKAIEFIQIYAKKNDYKIVLLEIEPHNDNARNLYKKYNFKAHNRNMMIYKI